MFFNGPFMGGWPWFGLLSWLIFWVALIVGIVLLIRYFARNGRQQAGFWQPGWHYPPPPPPGTPGPEQILAERYARGEIDEHEFQQRLTILRGAAGHHPPPPPPPAPGPAAPPPSPAA